MVPPVIGLRVQDVVSITAGAHEYPQTDTPFGTVYLSLGTTKGDTVEVVLFGASAAELVAQLREALDDCCQGVR